MSKILNRRYQVEVASQPHQGFCFTGHVEYEHWSNDIVSAVQYLREQRAAGMLARLNIETELDGDWGTERRHTQLFGWHDKA